MKFSFPTIALCSLICGTNGYAATLAGFSFTGGSLANDATAIAGISVTNISSDATGGTGGFNSFTSSSGWDSAAQISGAGAFFSGPSDQGSAGDALIFTITANPGFTFDLDGFSFRARSTNDAPADIGFTVGATAYDFSSVYSNNSTITSISNGALGLTDLITAEISIQGWNAGGSSSLQIDDLLLTGTVNSQAVIPEPSTFLLGVIGTLAFLRRRR
ncbi:MAG: PEP-CTERM sorting domain-containing protein [Akkermansiaceae bacterium]